MTTVGTHPAHPLDLERNDANALVPLDLDGVDAAYKDQQGLTKREMMATQLLAGILTNPDSNDRSPQGLSRRAVVLADALIAALNA